MVGFWLVYRLVFAGIVVGLGHGGWCVEVVWMRGRLLCGGVADRVTKIEIRNKCGR